MAKCIIIFEVTPKKDGVEAMFAHVQTLLPHVAQVPGFVGAEPFSSLVNEGKYCFLCVFESEEAAMAWRNATEHRAAQKDGHENLFESYKITVGFVVREYTHEERREAPEDSNSFFAV